MFVGDEEDGYAEGPDRTVQRVAVHVERDAVGQVLDGNVGAVVGAEVLGLVASDLHHLARIGKQTSNCLQSHIHTRRVKLSFNSNMFKSIDVVVVVGVVITMPMC